MKRRAQVTVAHIAAQRSLKPRMKPSLSYLDSRLSTMAEAGGLPDDRELIPSQETTMKLKVTILLALMASPLAVLADSPDATFYKKAAEGGMFEVDAGKMAQDKGSSQAVKDFGAMMVKDHSAANDKLKGIATSKNVDLPSSSSVGQMATKAKLDVLSGETFDKSYIKSQLKAHRETIALFRKESASGQDSDAKAFAKATLPTLREHMKEINSLAAGAGVSTK